jgi:hypothetical protein
MEIFNGKRKGNPEEDDDLNGVRRKVSHDESDHDMEEVDHTDCKSLKDLLDLPANIRDEQREQLSENTDMTQLLNVIGTTPESQDSIISQASISSTTVTIDNENDPLEANISSDDHNPVFLNRDGTFNVDKYKTELINLSTVPVQTGGKRRNNRYKRRHKTTMKKRKIIKGGTIRVWICGHKDFVAWVMMMSCLGGGYWCLAKFIIPIAIAELGQSVWKYIVKICETTAVIITNLFKTNGGLSKFIDLLVQSYSGSAVGFKILDDINTRIIKPFFDLIVSAITWGCENTDSDASADSADIPPLPNINDMTTELQTRLDEALAKIIRLETAAAELIAANPQQIEKIGNGVNSDAEPIIQEINDIVRLNAIQEGEEGEEDIKKMGEEDMKMKGGENIISYLAKKIKKTMKRRKRSHKKYAKKNIHYKSHKKNKR